MVSIRAAQPQDYEQSVLPLIRKYPGHLQQDRLPECEDFVLVEVFGKTVGCCALKVYDEKLAEIRSLAFSAWWWGLLLAIVLVRECIGRAKHEGVRQLLVTLGKKYRWVFWLLGFRKFNQEKYALLKLVEELKPFSITPIPGVIIEDLIEEDYEEVQKLPFTLEILLDPKFFPGWRDFCAAKVNGIIVGCCALVVFRRKEGDRPEMAEIRTLFVRPEYEGRGIGVQLCANRCNRAIELKVVELLATTKREGWFAKHFKFNTLRGAEKAWFKVLENEKR